MSGLGFGSPKLGMVESNSGMKVSRREQHKPQGESFCRPLGGHHHFNVSQWFSIRRGL